MERSISQATQRGTGVAGAQCRIPSPRAIATPVTRVEIGMVIASEIAPRPTMSHHVPQSVYAGSSVAGRCYELRAGFFEARAKLAIALAMVV